MRHSVTVTSALSLVVWTFRKELFCESVLLTVLTKVCVHRDCELGKYCPCFTDWESEEL